jgi:hypothetical protein
MGLQPSYGKGPHPLLWSCSRVARGKIAVSGIPKLLCNFYIIYTIYKCDRGTCNTT